MSAAYVAGTTKKRRWPKVLVITGFIVLLLIITTVLVIRRTYEQHLRPASSSEHVQQVTIPLGASVKEISHILEDAKLIKAAWAFEWYVRNNDAGDALQAGTYPLRPNQSIQDIVAILTNGKVSTDLVLIVPGHRIDQVRDTLVNYGFSKDEVEAALNASNYPGHAALVDKPPNANLEGYIFPESFEKTTSTKPQAIISSALDELQKVLTPDLRMGIVRQGLTIHEGIILASIVEKESGTEEDKPTIAQVFLKRYREGKRLESDATAGYGAVLSGEINDLSVAEVLSYDSTYNTYRYNGLPPGPISNFSKSSLEAIASPAQTDYLYFVADDEGQDKGRSFFSRTLQEHEANIAEHCKVLCN